MEWYCGESLVWIHSEYAFKRTPYLSASRRTLADLQLPVLCQEVVDKAEDSVLSEIEVALLRVAASILQGHGFAYAIPNRSKGNQLFVPELDRIVLKSSSSQRDFASTSTCRKAVITTRILQLVHELCSKRIHVTKRDLFYTDVKLFEVGTGEVTDWGGDRALEMEPGRFRPVNVSHFSCLRRATSMQDQGNSDAVLDDVACFLGCTRSSLNGASWW